MVTSKKLRNSGSRVYRRWVDDEKDTMVCCIRLHHPFLENPLEFSSFCINFIQYTLLFFIITIIYLNKHTNKHKR